MNSSSGWPLTGLLVCAGLAIRFFCIRGTPNKPATYSKFPAERHEGSSARSPISSQPPPSRGLIEFELQWGTWLLLWGTSLYLGGTGTVSHWHGTGWWDWPLIRGILRGYSLVGAGLASWLFCAVAWWGWRWLAQRDGHVGRSRWREAMFPSWRSEVVESFVAVWHPTHTLIIVLAIAQEIQDGWRASPMVATLLIAATSAALIARGARRWLNIWIPSAPLPEAELRNLRASDPEIAAALDAGWEIRDWAGAGNLANACLMPTPPTVWRWSGTGSQRVLVSRGLRQLLEPQELAAIIRHEIAHGVLQHGRCRTWGFLVPAIVGVAGVSQVWTLANSSGVGTLAGLGMAANLIAAGLLACMVGSLVSHWCEFAADQWACEASLSLSGGTVPGQRRVCDRNRIRQLSSALEKLEMRQTRRGARGTWFHPRIDRRLKHLRQLAGETTVEQTDVPQRRSLAGTTSLPRPLAQSEEPRFFRGEC